MLKCKHLVIGERSSNRTYAFLSTYWFYFYCSPPL